MEEKALIKAVDDAEIALRDFAAKYNWEVYIRNRAYPIEIEFSQSQESLFCDSGLSKLTFVYGTKLMIDTVWKDANVEMLKKLTKLCDEYVSQYYKLFFYNKAVRQ